MCRVEANPSTNLTFSWSKILATGREMEYPVMNITAKGLTSFLTITPENLSDFGIYHCKASNFIGEQKEPCKITLISAGPPEEPANCTVSPGSETLNVNCIEGFHGGFPQVFQLEAWFKEKLQTNITR